jgi:hypothetical protein
MKQRKEDTEDLELLLKEVVLKLHSEAIRFDSFYKEKVKEITRNFLAYQL